LSVLLSIVRGVLDPDRALPADHYLLADPAGATINLAHLRVDVYELLAAVDQGRRLFERGDADGACAVLAGAVHDYTGDLFEDEPYDDWAEPLRERARAAYTSALRTLADCHLAAGTTDSGVDHLLRLLGHDPYDEPAHQALIRALVAAGRHGAARRALARYRDAMRTIGVRPPDFAPPTPPVVAAGPVYAIAGAEPVRMQPALLTPAVAMEALTDSGASRHVVRPDSVRRRAQPG
jgi:DNA-binding SARP family transcriptional activator